MKDQRSDADKSQPLPGAGLFGLNLILVSLAIPFLVLAVCYVYMRSTAPEWLAADRDGLPAVLWASSLLIVLTSLTTHLTVLAVRVDGLPRARTWARVTLLLGLGFCVCQLVGWIQMSDQVFEVESGLRAYKASFFLLTGAHAVHVVGGLIIQWVVLGRLKRRRYWSLHHPGLRLAGIYWHFLDGLWLFVFVLLLLGS